MGKLHLEDLQYFDNDGTQYYKLYIACPICLRDRRPAEPKYWYHSADGGEMYIGENAYYYCKSCGHKAPIINWAYECTKCLEAGLEDAVKLDDYRHFAEAISIAGQISTIDAIMWLNKLTDAIMAQCGVHK